MGPATCRILVCGGRHYSNQYHVFDVLDRVNDWAVVEFVMTGKAKGADALAIEWCKSRGKHHVDVPALWGKSGTNYRAGPARNHFMAHTFKDLLDFCIAFPGGRGTRHMVSVCKGVGISVRAQGWDASLVAPYRY